MRKRTKLEYDADMLPGLTEKELIALHKELIQLEKETRKLRRLAREELIRKQALKFRQRCLRF
jgi:hypothetical protein